MTLPADRSPHDNAMNNANSPTDQGIEPEAGENWVDGDTDAASLQTPITDSDPPLTRQQPVLKSPQTLALVESAFLASTVSIIWLINYYFPLGPLLRILFPLPLALVYLRWRSPAAIKGVVAAGLLLSVLMGPTRSIVFLIPYGLMSLQLGFCWVRNAPWGFSILTGGLIGALGFFFRFWLFSILLGENLWRYVMVQITNLVDWIFLKLNILAQPDLFLVQGLAVLMIFVNSLIYMLAVHLVALLILDRLGNPIPRPPQWLKVILDYDY
ncbi:MAG: YybS family protein [Synechocystis sp.]|nr:YybS family protein [Synechocystis sp.]